MLESLRLIVALSERIPIARSENVTHFGEAADETAERVG